MVQKCIMFYYSTSTAVLLTQNKKWCGGWKKVYFAGVRWFGFLLNLVRLIMTSIALIKTYILYPECQFLLFQYFYSAKQEICNQHDYIHFWL